MKKFVLVLVGTCMLMPVAETALGGYRSTSSSRNRGTVTQPDPVQPSSQAPARVKPTSDIVRCDDDRVEIDLNADISFKGNAGHTITDEHGTYYNAFGYTWYEPKVYPPEYWGVFPLYFFGQRVGIDVEVQNEGTSKRAHDLKMITECYCLRTDGSNGAQLLAPTERAFVLCGNSSKSMDASFVSAFTPDAESGLDRFLVTIVDPVESDEPGDGDAQGNLSGRLNINPNNSDHNEFILTLPDGRVITRDDLHKDGQDYFGLATSIHVKPKGNGNQNTLAVDGVTYHLVNAHTYDISADNMVVHLYNDGRNKNGKAMGHWWIATSAPGATITHTPPGTAGGDALLLQEAIFCPPELDEELTEILEEAAE